MYQFCIGKAQVDKQHVHPIPQHFDEAKVSENGDLHIRNYVASVAALGLCVGLAYLSRYLDQLIEESPANKKKAAWSAFDKDDKAS
ncbi:unnamed protein product [Aphanomyces euteiches]